MICHFPWIWHWYSSWQLTSLIKRFDHMTICEWVQHASKSYSAGHQITRFKATEGLHPPPLPQGCKSTVQHCQLCYTTSSLHSQASAHIVLLWHCCVNFNLFVFCKFIISVVSSVTLLCGNMEDQPETTFALTTPVKWGRLGKSDIRNQNKRTIYNVYNYFQRHFWATWTLK